MSAATRSFVEAVRLHIAAREADPETQPQERPLLPTLVPFGATS